MREGAVITLSRVMIEDIKAAPSPFSSSPASRLVASVRRIARALSLFRLNLFAFHELSFRVVCDKLRRCEASTARSCNCEMYNSVKTFALIACARCRASARDGTSRRGETLYIVYRIFRACACNYALINKKNMLSSCVSVHNV